MKTILVILLALIFIPCLALAGPFLVCDAPTGQVSRYTGTIDGEVFETPYALHPSGAAIIYDLEGKDLTISHNFGEIKACNIMGCSQAAVTFSSPTVPEPAINLRFIH